MSLFGWIRFWREVDAQEPEKEDQQSRSHAQFRFEQIVVFDEKGGGGKRRWMIDRFVRAWKRRLEPFGGRPPP